MSSPTTDIIDALHSKLIADSNVTAVVSAANVHKWKSVLDYVNAASKPMINITPPETRRTQKYGHRSQYPVTLLIEVVEVFDPTDPLSTLDTAWIVETAINVSNGELTMSSGSARLAEEITVRPIEMVNNIRTVQMEVTFRRHIPVT